MNPARERPACEIKDQSDLRALLSVASSSGMIQVWYKYMSCISMGHVARLDTAPLSFHDNNSIEAQSCGSRCQNEL